MKRSWTSGLEKENATEVRANFKEALVMRKRLSAMMGAKIDASTKESRSKLLYDESNWALKQADQRGYERALSEIIELISDDVHPF